MRERGRYNLLLQGQWSARGKAYETSSINEIPRAVNWCEKSTRTSKAVVLSLFFFFRELKHPWLSKPPSPLAPYPSLSYVVALIIASKGPAPLLYLSIDDVPLSCAPSKKFLRTLINLRTQKNEVQKRTGSTHIHCDNEKGNYSLSPFSVCRTVYFAFNKIIVSLYLPF